MSLTGRTYSLETRVLRLPLLTYYRTEAFSSFHSFLCAGHDGLRGFRLPGRAVLYAQSVDRDRRPGHGQQHRTQDHLGRVPQSRWSREPSRVEFLSPYVRIQVSDPQRKSTLKLLVTTQFRPFVCLTITRPLWYAICTQGQR